MSFKKRYSLEETKERLKQTIIAFDQKEIGRKIDHHILEAVKLTKIAKEISENIFEEREDITSVVALYDVLTKAIEEVYGKEFASKCLKSLYCYLDIMINHPEIYEMARREAMDVLKEVEEEYEVG